MIQLQMHFWFSILFSISFAQQNIPPGPELHFLTSTLEKNKNWESQNGWTRNSDADDKN